MPRARFTADVVEGHKGVCAVLVPFDPEEVWRQLPVRLAGRRHGWPVKGLVAGARFGGYVGERWGRFFVDVTGLAKPGAQVAVALEPDASPKTLAKAIELSKATTQPGKARSVREV